MTTIGPKSRSRFSRRAFLGATGASPLLLPLLEPQLARGGCLPIGPRRAVFVIWPNGPLPGNDRGLWPAAAGGSESTFTLSAPMKSLEPYRADLVFIDQLNYQFVDDTPLGDFDATIKNGHSSQQGLLTGRKLAQFISFACDHLASGPSLDQYLGGELVKNGYSGLGSLHLGVMLRYAVYSVWRGARDPVAPDEDPLHAFNTVFAGRALTTLDPAIQRARRGRQSVIDFVKADLTRFKARLGTADRDRIEGHLTSIRAIEEQLLAVRDVLPEACVPKSAPPAIARASASIPQWMKLQMDILVAAMAADVTRVAILQFSDGQGETIFFPWLDGITGDFHNIKHGNQAGALEVDAWIYSQWAYLIGRFKNEKEGARSMLDTSVLTFMNNMTHGNHEWRDVPAFMAGGCGGTFTTGRCVQNKARGRYHQPLLVSVANAVLRDQPGFAPLTAWGDPEYNSGEMPGLRS